MAVPHFPAFWTLASCEQLHPRDEELYLEQDNISEQITNGPQEAQVVPLGDGRAEDDDGRLEPQR